MTAADPTQDPIRDPAQEYDVAVVGGGPAGIGVLVAADGSGALSGGGSWCLIDAGAPAGLGRGRLADYQVTSDTAGRVFVQTVGPGLTDDLPPGGSRRTAAALLERCAVDEPVPLAWAAALFELRAERVITRLVRRRQLATRSLTRVTRLATTASGFQLHLATSRGPACVRSRAVVLAPGGRPRTPPPWTTGLRGAAVHSESVLSMPDGALAALLHGSPPGVVIVGGSHSAFSAAGRILGLDADGALPAGAVTILHRGHIKVSCASPEAARADGIPHDASDVCPLTGRVFRFGGLRGASADLWRRWRDGLEPRLRLVDPGEEAVAARYCAAAGLTVAATGYDAASIDLVPESFARGPDGRLHPRVDGQGRYLDARGEVRAGLYGVGLGSAVTRDAAAGGEPSYTGPVDGLWFYQQVVATAIVADLARRRPDLGTRGPLSGLSR